MVVSKAFTLVELLVVISVMMVLAAISYPVMSHLRLLSDIKATRMLVATVHDAVIQYHVSVISGADGHGYDAWTLDWNGHPIPSDGNQPIDGDPQRYPQDGSHVITTVAPPGYRGLVFMTAIPIEKTRLDQYGRIIDRLRQPLQIAYSTATYGASAVGIWSMGPDQKNATADDIQSWTNDQQ
jgi:prepilin-type N-terminal cleavage/methylation domain-containing protein